MTSISGHANDGHSDLTASRGRCCVSHRLISLSRQLDKVGDKRGRDRKFKTDEGDGGYSEWPPFNLPIFTGEGKK